MSDKSIYSERPWLASYPEGTPFEIGNLEHNSIAQLVTHSCKKYADKPAFTSLGKTITFGEFLKQTDIVANWLVSKDIGKGDRVAIMMPNIMQMPIVMMAALRVGCTVVNVNPLYTPRELRHQLNDSGAKLIFVLENFAHVVEAVLDDTNLQEVVVTNMGDVNGGLKGGLVNLVVRRVKKLVPKWNLEHTSYKEIFDNADETEFVNAELSQTDLAFLQYTGGTTGVSKGAALTNANVLSNTEQNRLWLDVAFRAKGKPENINFVCALPLYHIFALTVNCLLSFQGGYHNILIPNPRDLNAFIKELAKWDIHIFPALNTLFVALLNREKFRQLNFDPLILTLGGGMAVQRPVANDWESLTGCVISEGYGLSETSPVAVGNRFDATEFTGTIGLPLPSTHIAIRDEEGYDLPLGVDGEICIKGPQVMAGYWNRPDETAKVMSEDGFFKSGDIGFMNEAGFTSIVDRKKDMILVSGFNVYPNEIEEYVVSHPDIVEAAAIGVPSVQRGEAVKLFVVVSNNALTEDDIKKWCEAGLTNYKRPILIEFRDELPKSNVGKILRRELRD